MSSTSSTSTTSPSAGRRLLALAVLSDNLIKRDPAADAREIASLQTLARRLYRSLPRQSRVAFLQHVRDTAGYR